MPHHIKDLTPGDKLETLGGPAVFIQHKAGNFRRQNYQVQLQNGQKRWYSFEQLKEAGSGVKETV